MSMYKIILLICLGSCLPKTACLQEALPLKLGIAPSNWLLLQHSQVVFSPAKKGTLVVDPIRRETGQTVAKSLVYSPFLPCFEADKLPVFCRIEHNLGKKMPLMIKFRLGSVEYVDMLEGKLD
jgi:hypothetical protein